MFDHKSLQQLLQPLIAENTTSSMERFDDKSNRGACDYLANQLERLGFHCQIIPVPDSFEKWNLIAHRAGTQTQDGGILFSGHIDTVPAALALWQSDPWRLKEEQDRLTGLGVTDMKGFFAVLLNLLPRLAKEHHRPITIIATADEETTMAGARAIKNELIGSPAMAIIGEPTLLKPIISHKGYLGFAVTLNSVGGHSSSNQIRYNCLDAMYSVIASLHQLRQELTEHMQNNGFAVPTATLNLGVLQAGDVVNRICARARLEFDIRPLPGQPVEELEFRVHQLVTASIKDFKVDLNIAPLYPPVEGFNSSINDDNMHFLCQCCSAKPETANYTTEAGFFEQLGCPTVVLGPGSIAQAHTANEWISLNEYQKADQVYSKLIDHICFKE